MVVLERQTHSEDPPQTDLESAVSVISAKIDRFRTVTKEPYRYYTRISDRSVRLAEIISTKNGPRGYVNDEKFRLIEVDGVSLGEAITEIILKLKPAQTINEPADKRDREAHVSDHATRYLFQGENFALVRSQTFNERDWTETTFDLVDSLPEVRIPPPQIIVGKILEIFRRPATS